MIFDQRFLCRFGCAVRLPLLLLILSAFPSYAENLPPCPEFVERIADDYAALALDSNASEARQRFYREMIALNTELYQAMACDAVELREAMRKMTLPDVIERGGFLKVPPADF